ncbi:MAG: hypothetical protein Q9180_000550 [Flavoplaca navasiana]
MPPILGFDDEADGFFPSDVLSFEEPRMLKDWSEPDVEDMLWVRALSMRYDVENKL